MPNCTFADSSSSQKSKRKQRELWRLMQTTLSSNSACLLDVSVWNSLHSEQYGGGPPRSQMLTQTRFRGRQAEGQSLEGSFWTWSFRLSRTLGERWSTLVGTMPRGTLSICPKALFRCRLSFIHLCHSYSFRVYGVWSTVYCARLGTEGLAQNRASPCHQAAPHTLAAGDCAWTKKEGTKEGQVCRTSPMHTLHATAGDYTAHGRPQGPAGGIYKQRGPILFRSSERPFLQASWMVISWTKQNKNL